jgi:hypothetical protein
MATTSITFPLNTAKVVDGYDAMFRLRPDGYPYSHILREYGVRKAAECVDCGGVESPPPARVPGCGCGAAGSYNLPCTCGASSSVAMRRR